MAPRGRYASLFAPLALTIAACGAGEPEPGSPEWGQLQERLTSEARPACDGAAVGQALEYDPDREGVHRIFEVVDQYRWGYVPDEWRASRVQEAELIACIYEQPSVLHTCEYVSEDASKPGGTLLRMLQYTAKVNLVVARSGERLRSETFRGGPPDPCPARLVQGSAPPDQGDPPHDAVAEWLEQFAVAP